MKMNFLYQACIMYVLLFFCAQKAESQSFEYIPRDLKSNCKDCDTTYLYNRMFNDSLFVAKKNGKYGVIDFTNKTLIPFEYDFIGTEMYDRATGSYMDYSGKFVGTHLVVKNEKHGFMDKNAKEIFPAVYDEIKHRENSGNYLDDKLILRKGNLSYLFNNTANYISTYGYDSIRFYTDRTGYWNSKEKIIASINGADYLLDSMGRKYFDFKNIRVRKNGDYVVLEDTVLNVTPLNIAPLASINRCEELNKDHCYAIVFCLNRYFVINKYAEMSAPFEGYPEYFDYKNETLFVKKIKKTKLNAIYDFKGRELGQISRYKNSELIYGNGNTEEFFVKIKNTKGQFGLVNSKGELLLDCVYKWISDVMDNQCTVEKGGLEKKLDVTTLVPLKWEK